MHGIPDKTAREKKGLESAARLAKSKPASECRKPAPETGSRLSLAGQLSILAVAEAGLNGLAGSINW